MLYDAATRDRPSARSDAENVILIGMAGAGKSTIGRILAGLLGWSFMDTDHLLEASTGLLLQQLADSMDKDRFLDFEARLIQQIDVQAHVIATGGSAIYRPEAIKHLRALGPLLYIDAPLALIVERITHNPPRGLAKAPGQTIEQLYNERHSLYEKAADMTIKGGHEDPLIYAEEAYQKLKEFFSILPLIKSEPSP